MTETSAPKNAFSDPDLVRRILYTAGALAVFRVGTFLPVPGVDAGALKDLVAAGAGGPLGVLDAFTGGGLGRFSLFSLGLLPYIVAMAVVGPLLGGRKRSEREDAARRLTPLLALVMALVLVRAAHGGRLASGLGALTLTAGALLLTWLCESITESGLGGGAMLVVFAGLVADFSSGFGSAFKHLLVEEVGLFFSLGVLAALLAAVAAVLLVETSQRKLTVNYAQRIVGRRMYGGAPSVLPLKLEQSGVVAAVTASVLVASVLALLPRLSGSWAAGDAACVALILYFSLAANANAVDANELAANLKKSGGSIPGVRPGDATAKYLQRAHERLGAGGAVCVAVIAVLPDLVRRALRLPFFFDGVKLLVIVAVALDAMGRVEAHGMRRAYAKFMK